MLGWIGETIFGSSFGENELQGNGRGSSIVQREDQCSL